MRKLFSQGKLCRLGHCGMGRWAGTNGAVELRCEPKARLCRFQISSRREGKARWGEKLEDYWLQQVGWEEEPASQPETGRKNEEEEDQEPRASWKAEKEGIEEEGARNYKKLGQISTEQREAFELCSHCPLASCT